jgi:hypothetical protein
MRAVGAKPEMSIPQGSTVWVWDSTWLPAVVVRPAQPGFVLVRFEHGVTCSVAMSDLQPRDITSRGSDRPVSGREFRDELRRGWSQQNSPREKVAKDSDPS